MSFIERKISSSINYGINTFWNKVIESLINDCSNIVVKESNLDTKADSDLYQIIFKLFNKYELKILQSSSSTTNFIDSYSIDDGNTFNKIHNSSFSIKNNNFYEINYIIIENDISCYLAFTQYDINSYNIYSSASECISSFLFINKNDKLISFQDSLSINVNIDKSATCYGESNIYKFNNTLNSIYSGEKIYYLPAIIKNSSYFSFSCDDYILSTNRVPLFTRFLINGRKYFSLSNYILMQYE